MLKVRARLSASGGLAQPGPLGEGPVVVALPRHRQPCHELLLRKAVRLRVDACPFLANGLNEVERLLSSDSMAKGEKVSPWLSAKSLYLEVLEFSRMTSAWPATP